MNDGSDATRISLRLADGDYFPVFKHGDPDTRNLSVVPAVPGQEEVDLHFFHHPSDGSVPVEIGTIRFRDLPTDEGNIELRLDAVCGPTGLFSVAVSHVDTGITERLEMILPEEHSHRIGAPKKSGSWKKGPLKWVYGTLFVAVCLTIIFFLTLAVTNLGKREPADSPVSVISTARSAV